VNVEVSARTLSRRLASVALAAGLVLGTAPVPLAAGHGGGPPRMTVTNKVHAAVHKDDRVKTRVKWQDRNTRARTVKVRNEAVAYASCRDCGAAAVAFQVLLASRATDLTVTNDAVAVNERCDSCATFAGAYQFVVAGDGDLRLTRAGAASLRKLQWQVNRMRAARLDPLEAQARADELADRVLQVLLTEVVAKPLRSSRQGGRPPVPAGPGASGSGGAGATAEVAPGAPLSAAALDDSATLTLPSEAERGVSVTLYRDVDLDPAG
jgi:hypothetical protein